MPDWVRCHAVLITQRSQVQILPPLPSCAGQGLIAGDGGRAFLLDGSTEAVDTIDVDVAARIGVNLP